MFFHLINLEVEIFRKLVLSGCVGDEIGSRVMVVESLDHLSWALCCALYICYFIWSTPPPNYVLLFYPCTGQEMCSEK